MTDFTQPKNKKIILLLLTHLYHVTEMSTLLSTVLSPFLKCFFVILFVQLLFRFHI